MSAWESACTVDQLARGHECGPPDRPIVLVVGNSHEPDGFNFVKAILADQGTAELVRFGNFNACGETRRTTTGLSSEDALCQTRLDALSSPALLTAVVT